jgi:hypothetical protein
VARKKKTKVFVSYSRHDEALVKPLASIIGVGADDSVFLDVTSLKPGDLWEEKVIGAVKESSVFVLCWCCESENSVFIAKEISTALSEGGKRLVPVLLCSTPLPAAMADRQWIDLRETILHKCPHPHPKKEQQKPSPAPASGYSSGGFPRSGGPWSDERSAGTKNRFEDYNKIAGQQERDSFHSRASHSYGYGYGSRLPSAPRESVSARSGGKFTSLLLLFVALVILGLIGYALVNLFRHHHGLYLIYAVAAVIALYAVGRLISSMIMKIRTRYSPEAQAERIAAAAASYFKGLGKHPPVSK